MNTSNTAANSPGPSRDGGSFYPASGAYVPKAPQLARRDWVRAAYPSLPLAKYVLLAGFVLPPMLSQTAAVLFAYITALLAALYVHSRRKSEILQFAWPLMILVVPLVHGLMSQEFWDWGRDVARLPKPAFALMAALLFGHAAGRRHGPAAIEKLAVLGAIASFILYLLC